MPRLIAGIFVGGASRRMGGTPKGLLPARGGSGETLVARMHRVLAACRVPTVLVGANEAYRNLGLEIIPDAATGAGPLGGLASLLDRAGSALALAFACDMPFVTEGLVGRLLAAGPGIAVAPKRAGRWEPFFARYDAEPARPIVRAHLAARELSLQRLLDALDARELVLPEDEASLLADWDEPGDLGDVGTGSPDAR